jgi:hypothetical protein
VPFAVEDFLVHNVGLDAVDVDSLTAPDRREGDDCAEKELAESLHVEGLAGGVGHVQGLHVAPPYSNQK